MMRHCMYDLQFPQNMELHSDLTFIIGKQKDAPWNQPFPAAESLLHVK